MAFRSVNEETEKYGSKRWICQFLETSLSCYNKKQVINAIIKCT